MTASGELQLGDFGLAAHSRHDDMVDRVGTLDYMVRVASRRGQGGQGGQIYGIHSCNQALL